MASRRNFQDMHFPRPPKVEKNGEMEPFTFFNNAFALSSKIQFKLGYFSTNALLTLSTGLAQFIYYNGVIDFAINHFLSENDYDLVNKNKELEISQINLIESKFKELGELNEFLKISEKHFFNCILYLIKKNRINITPIVCLDGGMAHYKEAIFTDSQGNKMYINGSCNFTASGILENGESFYVKRSWTNNPDDIDTIKHEELQFEKLFDRSATDKYLYLDVKKIHKVIREKADSKDKDLAELLEDEEMIREKLLRRQRLNVEQKKLEAELIEEIKRLKGLPKFPFENPYPYQVEAYKKWEENEFKGLFSMATGT